MNTQNKMIAFAAAGLFVLVGMYNAVVINSESEISSANVVVKRLDEIYGNFVPGRQVAGVSAHWKKLASVTFTAKKNNQNIQNSNTTTTAEVAPTFVPDSSVQEELSLSLVEVINPKRWEKGLTSSQFNGNLSTKEGVIESLSVSLPNGEGVSVAFSEMTGNVFEYDFNGEIYSGLMFQVDQHSYMVTLTNGPLEGTRLRFSSQNTTEQKETLAEANVETGSFGSEPVNPEALTQNDQDLQQEAVKAQGFNFGNSQTL
jgi:hypothetical protein